MATKKRSNFHVLATPGNAAAAADQAVLSSELVEAKRLRDQEVDGATVHHLHAPLDSRQSVASPSVTKGPGASLDSSQVGAFEVGQVVEVPVGAVRSNPLNPRTVYTISAVDEMSVSLQKYGQRVAAQGFVDHDGCIVLIEGETRLRGARAAGLRTLRVEIRPRPGSERELYESARAANVERRDQTPLDDAERWKDLLERGIYKEQQELAQALGIDPAIVSRTLSLAKLPHKLMMTIAEHKQLLNLKMLNALREFWAFAGDDATIELIREAAENGMGYRDVAARRKKAEEGPTRRPRAHRAEVTFRGIKGEIKTFEDGGRVELVLKGLSPADAAELGKRLKAFFPQTGEGQD